MQKLLTFFQQTFQHICISLDINFNESLTNDVVSFEQVGPGLRKDSHKLETFVKCNRKSASAACLCS